MAGERIRGREPPVLNEAGDRGHISEAPDLETAVRYFRSLPHEDRQRVANEPRTAAVDIRTVLDAFPAPGQELAPNALRVQKGQIVQAHVVHSPWVWVVTCSEGEGVDDDESGWVPEAALSPSEIPLDGAPAERSAAIRRVEPKTESLLNAHVESMAVEPVEKKGWWPFRRS